MIMIVKERDLGGGERQLNTRDKRGNRIKERLKERDKLNDNENTRGRETAGGHRGG